jgi:glucose/arabinose dehydrogenase
MPRIRTTKRRQHLNPIAAAKRKSYLAAQKRRHNATSAQTDNAVMHMLIQGLANPLRTRACAQRLLADYTYAQLSMAVYMRARRVLAPEGDHIRAKVARGKPGVLNESERRDYATRLVVQTMKARLTSPG